MDTNLLVKESFYGKQKIKDGISFNSILVGDRISFSIYNQNGIILYESFDNIDSLKETLNVQNKSEREQFIYNLVSFLLDIKETRSLNENLQEDTIEEPEEPEEIENDEEETEDIELEDDGDDDSSELDNIHSGNLTSNIGTFLRPNVPKIYAFITKYVPNAIKIGFTTKSAEQRIDQWREKYDDADLIYWWPSTLLVDNVKSYFKDFPVHEETIEQGFDNLAKTEFSTNIHYSKEFFKKLSREDQNKELTKEIISEIIDIVKDKIIKGTGSKAYQSYKLDSNEKNDEVAPKEANFVDTSLQAEAIRNGIAAYRAGNTSMLLAAVMRFGKTHVAYSIAKGVGARFVVVASAKVDTKGEWRNGIYHSKFRNAVFIEFKDNYTVLVSDRMNGWYMHEVGLEDFNIDMYIDEGRMTVVFASLQDLSGKKEKPVNESLSPIEQLLEARLQKTKHNFIFNRVNDLFIIDETHYGARAGIYGKTVKGDSDEEYGEESVEQKQFNKYVGKIPTKCQLHLSGTPYQILSTDEFNKEGTAVIGRYSYTDMIAARDQWIKLNVDENNPNSLKEEDSPFFGIPDIIRFGLKLTKECRKALNTQMKETNSTDRLSYLFAVEPNDATKFHFEDAITELAEAIFGGEKVCGFLNDDTIVRGQIFNHIVGVLPSVKACHAFKKLLIDKKLLDAGREVIVAVENESTPKRDRCTETVQTLNKELEKLDNAGKKSLTLTWGRFLTGASVPLWDSMLYLKDTENAQEYDQAIFRICTRHTGIARSKDANGKEIVEKINLKPNVYLVDFKIDRMFNIIADSARNQADVKGDRGLAKLEGHIARDLTKIPLYVEWGKGKKMGQVQPQDFMKYYTKYNENSSIEDLIKRGFDKLKGCIDKAEIRNILSRFSESSLHVENKVSATTGDGESNLVMAQGTVDNEGTFVPSESKVVDKKKRDEFEGKLVSMIKNILYCIICLDGSFNSLGDLIDYLKNDSDAEEIAKDFLGNDCISILEFMNTNLDNISLNEIDAEIRNVNNLLNDPDKTEIERVNTAIKKLGKLDRNEVITPSSLATKMVEKLDDSDYINAESILEVNSKTGEFLVEIYKKYGKDVADKVKIVPSSKITRHFIEKILTLLDLDKYNLLDIETKEFLSTDINMKFDICLMNPPYDNKLHVKFLKHACDLGNNIISIQPAGWLIRLYKKTLNNDDSKLFKLFNEVETNVELVEGNNFFDAAISDQLGIFNINTLNKVDGIDIKALNTSTYMHFDDANNINLFEADNLLKVLLEKLKTNNYAFNHLRCTEYLRAGLKNKSSKIINDTDNTNNWWCVNIAQIRGHQYNGIDKDFYTWIPNNKVPEKFDKKNPYLIFPFADYNTAQNFINYLKTDFARSVLYFYKNSTQLIPATDYLPWFDFSDKHFSKTPKEIDDYLFKKYNISDDIRKHIEEILPDYYDIRK